MRFSIRYSTIGDMLSLCNKLNIGEANKEDIRKLLKHDDYIFELERYGSRVTEDDFVDYFLDIPNLDEDDIKNNDLKIHHRYYKDLINNLDFYIGKFEEFKKLLTNELFEEQIKIALKGLPGNIILPQINFIFTIGIGQSFGYAHKDGTHFDFLQLAKDKSISEFCSTISHEVHHIGVNIIHDKIDLNSISLEELFYLYFSGEGLAVKYCNNAEGIISKSIYDGPKNIGLDSYTWKYLNDDFNNTMIHFKEIINDIRREKIKSIDDLNKDCMEYWMNPYIEGQSNDDIPKLKHFRYYSFGNEIFGIIHDCFGKDAVYNTLSNLKTFPAVYNKALDKLGYGEFKI
ncbi:hypothetical protein CHL78_009925 [Romboutsia weinsteinii]|uniref:DUF2268 domain-containing protein n=1 Tax=Romboutsia weinsteinii TaxID=2020949 RepID=A0A371J3I0_9FIRM|nr:DUF5700 domain-containing putative Zn-dependent protease [Romboutsia weinsteinii]RDY27295.1 hypothetical protein CHL78_009925 [Romboutsia weinsteinii]